MTINPARNSLSLPSAVETRGKGWDGAVRQGLDQGERGEGGNEDAVERWGQGRKEGRKR